MVRIEEHWHERSPLDLPLPNQAAEAADLREGFVAGKDAHDFPVPRFVPPPGNGDLQIGEFLFNPFEPGFQLACGSRHGVIIVRPARKNNRLKGRTQVLAFDLLFASRPRFG